MVKRSIWHPVAALAWLRSLPPKWWKCWVSAVAPASARVEEKLIELLPSEDSRGESGRFAAPQRHDVISIARGNGLKSGANCLGQGIPPERLLE